MTVSDPSSEVLQTSERDWVYGHSDYRRAAETLRAVQRAAEQVPSVADPVMSAELVRLANQNVEGARRRVAEVEADLIRKFKDLRARPCL
jgi:phage-related minor tail protein